MKKIILLDRVEKLGSLGDIVSVKAGYARNYLVPQKKAILATKKNIASFRLRRLELENKLEEVLYAAKERAEKINSLERITIRAKAGEEGKLFGSIGIRDIIQALISFGIEVTKREVRLLNGVLRTVGEHEVHFHLHSGVFAKLYVNVISE